MSQPAVSVVIPTRNRANLLPAAIRSALGQTFRDLEVIVVDDASDDDTRAVVAGFADPRLRYFRQEVRSGSAAVRNAAIGHASGEYIAFLDDDDEWFAEKLDLQIGLFRRSPAQVGIVYSSYLFAERESGRVIGRFVAEKRGDLSRDLLARNFLGGISAIVVRRSCFEKSGLFDGDLPSYIDYDLWLRMSRDFHFDFIDRDLVKYSVHGNRISTDLDAVDRGIERMLGKHGSFSGIRRSLAGHSLAVGVQYCSRGEIRRGRRSLARSVRLNPARVHAHLYLGLSLFGSRVFRGVHEMKDRLTGRASGKGELR